MIQLNQDGLKINWIHQLLWYVDVNMCVVFVHTVKRHTEALLVDSKESGLEVNVDKAKYMIMSGNQKHKKSLYKN